MFAFIVVCVIIAICFLLFGKADTKRSILQEVGLDFSKEGYENKKEDEFEKNCIKGMYNAIDIKNCKGNNEMHFLIQLRDVLNVGAYGEEENNLAYLRVKSHYLEHAERVVCRRIEKLRDGETTPLMLNCNFSLKSDTKKYVKKLWEKYQYPWPKNWLQKDSDL